MLYVAQQALGANVPVLSLSNGGAATPFTTASFTTAPAPGSRPARALGPVFRAALGTRQVLLATMALVRRIGWRRLVLVAPYDLVGAEARQAFYEATRDDALEKVDVSYVPGEPFTAFASPIVAPYCIFVIAPSTLDDLFRIVLAAYQRGILNAECAPPRPCLCFPRAAHPCPAALCTFSPCRTWRAP